MGGRQQCQSVRTILRQMWCTSQQPGQVRSWLLRGHRGRQLPQQLQQGVVYLLGRQALQQHPCHLGFLSLVVQAAASQVQQAAGPRLLLPQLQRLPRIALVAPQQLHRVRQQVSRVHHQPPRAPLLKKATRAPQLHQQ
jgi:hypothetical protein